LWVEGGTSRRNEKRKGENDMKTIPFPRAAAAALLLTALGVAPAGANCLTSNAKLNALRASSQSALAMKASAPDPNRPDGRLFSTRPADPKATVDELSVVGFWYVRFSAGGQLVDDGFDAWLSDGIEMLNDSPAPSSGAVCMGVWTKTAPFTYVVKHPSWIFDDAGVNLIGIAVISEQIKLNATGDTFTGTATLDIYDLSGNPLEHYPSTVTGQRIVAVDSPPTVGGIPGLPRSILNR
jgi:hypothetical protein